MSGTSGRQPGLSRRGLLGGLVAFSQLRLTEAKAAQVGRSSDAGQFKARANSLWTKDVDQRLPKMFPQDEGYWWVRDDSGTIWKYASRDIDITALGADPTGRQDATEVFRSAYRLLTTYRTPGAWHDPDRRGTAAISLPPGSYLVTGDAALMDTSNDVPADGIAYRGAGNRVTRIDFRPSDIGQCLFRNHDRWKFGTITGIEFFCRGDYAPFADFMDLYSTGHADGFVFREIRLNGHWRRGFWLHGKDTGSELFFSDCSFGKTFEDAMLYIGYDATDQFVDYFFHNCNAAAGAGDVVYAAKGGSINWYGGSMSCNPHRKRQGWIFNLASGDHGEGAMRLDVRDLRIEYKGSGLIGLLRSRWKGGTISFASIHDNATFYPGGSQPKNLLTVDVSYENAAGPIVLWDNCMLSGIHRYTALGDDVWQSPSTIVYRACEFAEKPTPEEFVHTVAPAGPGALPVVHFENCRSRGNRTPGCGADWQFNQSLNWNRSALGQGRRYLRVFADSQGPRLPEHEPLRMRLPLHALVMQIIFIPADGIDPAPLDLEVAAGPDCLYHLARFDGSTMKTASTQNVPVTFICDSEAKQILQLRVASGRGERGAGRVLVEYIA